ncbi:MAG: hypothetical protein ACHQ1D_03850 [Nitrososphaerales archaeon]
MIISPGTKVINSSNPIDDYGTVGGSVMYEGSQYVITCFHCVFTNGMDWDETEPIVKTEVKFLINGNFVEGGQIKYTWLNANLDIALIKLYPEFTLDNNIRIIGAIKDIRILLKENRNNVWVRKLGATTGFSTGKFIGFYPQLGAELMPHNKTNHLLNLLKFESKGSKPFAKRGDSGSWIIDSENNLVGILVMLLDGIAFAISMQSIMKKITLNT